MKATLRLFVLFTLVQTNLFAQNLITTNGKVLEVKTISSSTYTWNLQYLPAGTYILKGQGWGQKVVKE
jgi:hypothetical protein